MKSAYELAMERLSKSSPPVQLSNDQKQALAELDSKYTAKIAERELTLKDEIERAAGAGDFEGMEKLQQQLVIDRKSLREELEAKKEHVRSQGK